MPAFPWRERARLGRIGWIRRDAQRAAECAGLSPERCPKASVIIIAATIQLYPPEAYERVTREAVEAFEAVHPGRQIAFYTRAGYSGEPGSAAYESFNFPGDETTDWSQSSGLASLTRDMLNRAIGETLGETVGVE